MVLLCLAICLSTDLSAGTTNNGEPILNHMNISVDKCSLDLNNKDNQYFQSIYYSAESEKICFKAKATIQYVQVLDSKDAIVLVLPIDASTMHLSLNELDSGVYKVNILIDGAKEVISTQLTKK